MIPDTHIDRFLDILGCGSPLGHWVYDGSGELLSSTFRYAKIFHAVLRKCGGLEKIFAAGDEPFLCGMEYGISWLGMKEYGERKVMRIHLLGPFFAGETKPLELETLYASVGRRSSRVWRETFREAVESLPVLPHTLYCQTAVSFCYMLTGSRVETRQIQHLVQRQEVPQDFSNLKVHTPPKDRTEIYWAERALLNAVREGDVEGGSAMGKMSEIAKVRSYTNDPLRNVQIGCTIFTALCIRSAIEGGLTPTLSYSRGDAYIKSICQAKSEAEVSSIKNQMYNDFIARVHGLRRNPLYSKMVQSSCDYIELHLAEPLSIEVIATRLGYAKYYLSTQFKKETGNSINDYIKFVRVERAKVLLSTTDHSIEHIAEETGFVSRSFFSNTFKRCMGKTPVEYRKEEQAM